MRDKNRVLNYIAFALFAALVIVVIWGVTKSRNAGRDGYDDGIAKIDLDTIYLKGSGVEVDFSDVLLSDQNETRKLIVSTQDGTVSTELTDRLIRQLDFDFLKKTQKVSYKGTGYFVVDLDGLSADDIIEDGSRRTVTIRIGHAYLQTIEIDPNQIIIDEVQEGLLARGDIKLTVADCNVIEKELRSRLETKFNTAANAQLADDLALKMVREIYEPIVTAIDPRYSVIIEFK